MTPKILTTIYIITVAFLAINVILVFLRKDKIVKITGLLTLLLLGFGFISFCVVNNRFPVYGKYETLLNINFLLVLITYFYGLTKKKDYQNKSYWILALIFQLTILTEGIIVSDDYYMYTNPFVVLFFQSRITSIGLFSYALSCFIDSYFINPDNKSHSNLLKQGKNFTLLGGTIYLLGEFSGSVWCFQWWGDAWHWSKGFFLASIMFLLAMINSHLPVKLNKPGKVRVLLNGFPVLAIILTYILSH